LKSEMCAIDSASLAALQGASVEWIFLGLKPVLATHSFFEPEGPASPQSPINSPLPVEENLTRNKFFHNLMHRSGLALAGAESTLEAWKRGEIPPVENDGILTAADVSRLDLKGTWLVTLSACETGPRDRLELPFL
jgi:hypothetical protein